MTAGSGAQGRMLSELERLKVRARMSFAQLQSAVPYSRSGLHRYFTGQSPIPRDALVAVVRACGGDEAAMVRMWEAAQADPALGADTRLTPSATPPYVQSPDSQGHTGEYPSAWALRDTAPASTPEQSAPSTPAPTAPTSHGLSSVPGSVCVLSPGTVRSM
jgi:hypothetical protein